MAIHTPTLMQLVILLQSEPAVIPTCHPRMFFLSIFTLHSTLTQAQIAALQVETDRKAAERERLLAEKTKVWKC